MHQVRTIEDRCCTSSALLKGRMQVWTAWRSDRFYDTAEACLCGTSFDLDGDMPPSGCGLTRHDAGPVQIGLEVVWGAQTM